MSKTQLPLEHGTIRVCPERDARCPHGINCPYAKDRGSCDMVGSRAALNADHLASLQAEVERLTALTEAMGHATREQAELCGEEAARANAAQTAVERMALERAKTLELSESFLRRAEAAEAEVERLDQARLEAVEVGRISTFRAEEAEAAVARLREALREIASQRTSHELTTIETDESDWTGGFDICVERAREALRTTGESK